MALVDHTRIRREGMAAIAAVVGLIALAVATSVPPWAVAWPTASPPGSSTASSAGGSADSEIMASRKDKRDVGLRGHGFVGDGDVFTTIDAPNARGGTRIFDLDEGGRLVGAYDLVQHGYVRPRRGDVSTFDHPDAGRTTEGIGINSRGQLVGQYGDASARIQAFLLADGVFTPIEAPGVIHTNASEIHARGQVVGFSLGTSAGP
jgi:hypothetical protein